MITINISYFSYNVPAEAQIKLHEYNNITLFSDVDVNSELLSLVAVPTGFR